MIGDLPGVEFIVFDKNRGFKAYLELRRALQARVPFDALLQMQTSLRANLVGAMIRARRKIGFPVSKAKELHGFFVTEHLPETDAFHVLDVFKHFTSGLGITDCETTWDIPLPTAAITRARHWLGEANDYALICPSAASNAIGYPICHHRATLPRAGLKVVLTGSPAEREVALAADRSSCNIPIHNLAGKPT